MAIQDDVLGYWDCRTPFYPIFHEDDKTITFLWTEYDEEFEVFYKSYISDMKQYGKSYGITLSKEAPPSNNYIISLYYNIYASSLFCRNHHFYLV